MSNSRPISRAKPVSPSSKSSPYLTVFGIIAAVGLAVVGVAVVLAFIMKAYDRAKPVSVPGPPDPVVKPLTTDAELIAWKDDPKSFKGKTLRVKAMYRFGQNPIRNNVEQSRFHVSARYNDVSADVNFLVFHKSVDELPNITEGDSAVIEFVCEEGSMTIGNHLVSITR